jgi:ketosteroid isomerase-like protein
MRFSSRSQWRWARNPASLSAQSDNEKQLLAISAAWGDAEAKHDEAALDRYVDDRFLFIASNGQIIDGKAAYIEAVRKFSFTSTSVVENQSFDCMATRR